MRGRGKGGLMVAAYEVAEVLKVLKVGWDLVYINLTLTGEPPALSFPITVGIIHGGCASGCELAEVVRW